MMTMEVVKSLKEEEEHTIKPQAVTPAVDTSSWPLLLKNYDKRECQNVLEVVNWFLTLGGIN